MKTANLALSFILEMFAVMGFAYATFVLGPRLPWKAVFAVGLPVSLAVVWSLFLSRRASHRIPMPSLLLVKLTIFTAAAAALYFAGRPYLASLLLALITLNAVLVVVWKQF